MTSKIAPLNRMAQVLYRAKGNPENTLVSSAISNCFPGLEYDFKAFWRRAFVGLVLLECDNYVVGVENPQYQHLLHHRLLKVDDRPVVTTVTGPQIPGGDSAPLTPKGNPNSVISMEWSNVLAFAMQRQGKTVTCWFTLDPSPDVQAIPKDTAQMLSVDLKVRRMLDGPSVAPDKDLLQPGELTQGLCSPWQHDYRECACYYWPASRPDYVNIEPTSEGVSRGDNWMSKARHGTYLLDNRHDSQLITYDELFQEWERLLQFQVKGRDAEES
jgi:hypothetical protein